MVSGKWRCHLRKKVEDAEFLLDTGSEDTSVVLTFFQGVKVSDNLEA